jgi:hypothetical protein
MQHFVRRSTFAPFRRFWGDMRREFLQRLAFHGLLLFITLWAPIVAMLCERAVSMLRHALLSSGLGLWVCLFLFD